MPSGTETMVGTTDPGELDASRRPWRTIDGGRWCRAYSDMRDQCAGSLPEANAFVARLAEQAP